MDNADWARSDQTLCRVVRRCCLDSWSYNAKLDFSLLWLTSRPYRFDALAHSHDWPGVGSNVRLLACHKYISNFYDRSDGTATTEHRLSLLQLLPLGSIQPIRIVHPVLSMTTIYFSAIALNESVRKNIYACVHLAEIGATNTRMVLDVAYIQYIFTSSEL